MCVCCVLKAGEGWGWGPRSWAEGWRGEGAGVEVGERQPDRGAITAGSSGQDQAVSWTIHLQSSLHWGDASPSSNFTRQWRFKVKASPGLLWPFLTEQLLKQAPCSSRRAWLEGLSQSGISGILYWLIKIIIKKTKQELKKKKGVRSQSYKDPNEKLERIDLAFSISSLHTHWRRSESIS